MPFELGLDVGCRRFGPKPWIEKPCLILESQKYRYQAALSDLSGVDIAAHDDEPQELVRIVRNWLNSHTRRDTDAATQVLGRFLDFMTDDYKRLRAKGFSKKEIAQLPIGELKQNMTRWVGKVASSA